MRNKIEKTHVKEKNIIITHTRQYLHGSAICLRLWSCRDFTIIKEKYKVRPKPPLHELSLKKSSIKNHKQSFRVESSSRSNTTRFHKAQQISYLETSSITNINRNPQKQKKNKKKIKKKSLIPATHLLVLKLEDQLKLHIASTSQ